MFSSDKGNDEVQVQVFDHDQERQSPRSSLAQQQHNLRNSPTVSAFILRCAPKVFLISYFVFSISIYTIVPPEAAKVFWFLYLTIATFLAATTVLEAYDGLSVHSLARKAVARVAQSGWTGSEADLPSVELIMEDGDDDVSARTLALQTDLVYPHEKLTITILPEFGDDDADLRRHILHSQHHKYGTARDVVAIFRKGETPHPHAIRHAVERLDAKKNAVEMVQSRSVLASTAHAGWFHSFYSSLAAFNHDSAYGLTLPGRTITWSLPLSHGSAVFCKTAALQAALSKTSELSGGPSLALAAYANNLKATYDLSVISYRSCPASLVDCIRMHIRTAAEWIRAMPFLGLVFLRVKHSSAMQEKQTSDTKPIPRTIKKRIGILYTLLLQRLGSHAILQYFSLSFALLITSPPASAADFSRQIFFPYTISLWLIVAGLVCLVGTVAIAHSHASEFSPRWWTFPLLLIWWPFGVLGSALLDVYAQACVVLGLL